MKKPLKPILTDLRKFFILNPEKRSKYIVNPDKSFTRNRILSFEHTALLILSLLKKVSLSNYSIISPN